MVFSFLKNLIFGSSNYAAVNKHDFYRSFEPKDFDVKVAGYTGARQTLCRVAAAVMGEGDVRSIFSWYCACFEVFFKFD